MNEKRAIAVVDIATRMSMNLPTAERVNLVQTLFNTLDDADKKQLFKSFVAEDISLLDALTIVDAEEEKPQAPQKTEEKPVVKQTPAKKPVAKQSIAKKPAAKKTPAAKKETPATEEKKEEEVVVKQETEEGPKFLDAVKKNADKEVFVPTELIAKRPVVARNAPRNRTNVKIFAETPEEMRDLMEAGKSLCGFHDRGCIDPKCQWIHVKGDFLCTKSGPCKCRKTHLSDLPEPKNYNAGTQHVASTQEEYDDARKNGLWHCSHGSYCYRACSFLHIAKGKQCLDINCEDAYCDKVHVGYCYTYDNTGRCKNWEEGRCGFMH